jgi:hypothetical protein
LVRDEEKTLERYKEHAPKHCPSCGEKLEEKYVSAYVGDAGGHSCKEQIYYSTDCPECKKYWNLDGPLI